MKKVETNERECKDKLNANIKRRIDEIDGSIEATDFKEAADYLETLSDIFQFCDTTVNEENSKKYEHLKATFDKKIQTIIEEYGKREIKDYQRYPLK